jgi:N-acetylmuramoyl-L-alanine amidase
MKRVDNPTHIMIHHSLTEDGESLSWQAIRAYHTLFNKWADIGYHYGVERVNGDVEVLVGRPESDVAAACKEGKMNERAIHVCCVGNFDTTPPSPQVIDKLIKYVVVPLMKRYKIPIGNIVAHRDYASYKTCPGGLFDMVKFREKVKLEFS